MMPQPQPRRVENLALVFQELLTVGERLRANRQQVGDAASFRAQLWARIKLADEEARRQNYQAADIELAIFAVVAFLDESILNLRLPVFVDWPRQPMQEERFGHHMAGEIFFQNIQALLRRSDSQELADLLEVYQLCLLLGFVGRYSMGGRGELRSIATQVGDKIQRIRRTPPDLAPAWMLPGDAPVPTAGGDPWFPRLAITAGACFLLALALFLGFDLMLGSGVDGLRKLAGLL